MNTNGPKLPMASLMRLRMIHLIDHVHLMISHVLLMCVVSLITINSEIHQSLDGLFSLWCIRLEFVEWIIQNLFIIGEELTKVLEIYLNDIVFREELPNNM